MSSVYHQKARRLLKQQCLVCGVEFMFELRGHRDPKEVCSPACAKERGRRYGRLRAEARRQGITGGSVYAFVRRRLEAMTGKQEAAG